MTDLERAIETYHSGGYAFVLVKHGHITATGTRAGIEELLQALAESPDAMRGASLADRVVGKAVAMVAVFAEIADVYTPLGSESAVAVLAKHKIPFQVQRIIPFIQNRRNDGPCPMERLTLPISDPEVAVAALKAFVAQRGELAHVM